MKAREIMTQAPAVVVRDEPISRAAQLMEQFDIGVLPVVGIIAQADLAVRYAGHDPQRGLEVEEMIEQISEPAPPKR